MATSPQLYANRFAQLMPEGPAWSDDSGNLLLNALYLGLSGELARTRDALIQLLEGFMPDTATEVDGGLLEWGALLGLDGSMLTLDQRRGQVIAKLRGFGDPNTPNMLARLQAVVPGAVLYSRVHAQPQTGDAETGDVLDTYQAYSTAAYMTDVRSVPSLVGGAAATGTGEGRYGGTCPIYLLPAAGVGSLTYDIGAGTKPKIFSAWVRQTDVPLTAATFRVATRVASAGSSFYEPVIEIMSPVHGWWQVFFTVPAGSGTGIGQVVFANLGAANAHFAVSNAVAGDKDAATEALIAQAMNIQVHSLLEFAVIGQY